MVGGGNGVRGWEGLGLGICGFRFWYGCLGFILDFIMEREGLVFLCGFGELCLLEVSC